MKRDLLRLGIGLLLIAGCFLYALAGELYWFEDEEVTTSASNATTTALQIKVPHLYKSNGEAYSSPVRGDNECMIWQACVRSTSPTLRVGIAKSTGAVAPVWYYSSTISPGTGINNATVVIKKTDRVAIPAEATCYWVFYTDAVTTSGTKIAEISYILGNTAMTGE